MHKKKKVPQQNRAARDASAGGDQKNQCRWNGETVVHGKMAIALPNEYFEQKHSSQQEVRTSSNRQLLVNWLTFGAVLIYAGLTAWLGFLTRDLVQTSQRTYEASNRPYVGINDIVVMYADVGPQGTKEAEFTTRPITDVKKMSSSAFMFDIEVKNFGSVPGENTRIDRKTFFGGSELSTPSIPDKPSTIFPSQTLTIRGVMGRDYYSAIMLGTKTLVQYVTISYDGPSHRYSYCAKEQFNPKSKHFMDLGPICSP